MYLSINSHWRKLSSCICSTILTFHFLLASRLSFNSTFCIPEGWYELGLPTTFSVSSGFCFHSEKWNKPRVCSWWVIQENIAPPPHLGDQLKWRKMLFSNQRGGELCKFDNLQSQQMQSFSVFFLASHSHLALSWVSPIKAFKQFISEQNQRIPISNFHSQVKVWAITILCQHCYISRRGKQANLSEARICVGKLYFLPFLLIFWAPTNLCQNRILQSWIKHHVWKICKI